MVKPYCRRWLTGLGAFGAKNVLSFQSLSCWYKYASPRTWFVPDLVWTSTTAPSPRPNSAE